MSYQERGNSVILTMSREDYDHLLMLVGAAIVKAREDQDILAAIREYRVPEILSWLNRLNSGNPNYTPYSTEHRTK